MIIAAAAAAAVDIVDIFDIVFVFILTMLNSIDEARKHTTTAADGLAFFVFQFIFLLL